MRYRAERVNCPVKLPKIDRDKSKVKLAEDRLTFQKVMEVCFNAYMKNNKAIMELVSVYSDTSDRKKTRRDLTELEAQDILKLIEAEHSPFNFSEGEPNAK
jgi:hypothetical protein